MVGLWRLDAQHAADGAFTTFWRVEGEAHREAQRLRAFGWEVDVYPDLLDLETWPVPLRQLLARPWPVAPLAAIVEILECEASAVAKARADLAAIQQRQGHS